MLNLPNNQQLSNGHAARPPAQAQRPMPQHSTGYDYWGAFVRRKWLVILPTIVGVLLGFLYFSQQAPVYASSLKLMIWTQAPPRLVNGETVVQEVSLGKHENLLASQVVLSKAIREGNLGATETFKGNPQPLGALKGMLKVSPVFESNETLVLTLRGPVAAETPLILEHIATAYQSILSEDTEAIGRESTVLIEKLQSRIDREKNTAESRYLELIRKLNISPDAKSGQFTNPFAERVSQIQDRIDDQELALRETTSRMLSVRDLKDLPPERQAQSVKVVALEAAKYLGISTEDGRSGLNSSDAETRKQERTLSLLDNQLRDTEATLVELRLKGEKISKAVGAGHPSATSNALEMAFYEKQLKELRAQQELVASEVAALELAAKQVGQTESANASLLKSSKQDQELVQVYLNSLVREQTRLKTTVDQLQELRNQQDEQAKIAQSDIEELNILALEIAQKDTVTREMVDRLGELAVLSGNFTSTKVRVIDPPGVGLQVEPKLTKYLPLGGILGAMLGFGLLLLLDWSDLSFRNPHEIEEKLGVPVIARIPRLTSKEKFKDGRASELVTVNRPKSAAAEAYRACRTSLLFSAHQHDAKVLLISSPNAGDGKSTTATNLALSFAIGGHKTVLVDADLRKPRCNKYLGVNPSKGLKDLQQGTAQIDELAHPCALSDSLHFIAAGGHMTNSSEFLGSPQCRDLLQHLRDTYDFVIVDSPPILPVADAAVLSGLCDAVLLVFKIRRGVVLAARKAVDLMNSVDANIVGVLVNSVDGKSHYSEYGKYGYSGYGGYAYYANRYYEKENKKYYTAEKATAE